MASSLSALCLLGVAVTMAAATIAIMLIVAQFMYVVIKDLIFWAFN